MKTRKQSSRKSDRTGVSAKISKILRQARLNKNYSLDDLHRITKIKGTYLKAVDSGDFKKIPEGFYLRAYIKAYADTVGLNGTELLNRFNNELPDLQDPHFMNRVSEDKLLVRVVKQRVQNRHSTVRKYIPLVVMVVVVFVVLVGIWVVASRSHSNLTSNYHSHSTSVSGESSIKRVKHKAKKHKSHKRRIVIKKDAQKNNRLIYNVASKIRPLHLTLDSPDQMKVTVNNGKASAQPTQLKPNQKKSIKLNKHDKSVRLDMVNSTKVKLKINHKAKQLKLKRSIQSITLKFSK